MTLTAVFDEAVNRKASDIHFASGESPCLRISGELIRMDAPALDRQALCTFLEPFLPSELAGRLDSGTPIERTLVHGDLAFTGIAFSTGINGLAATFRILSGGVPDLEKIGEGAMPLMERITAAKQGFVIVSGPAGSGKWTTGCSLVDRINKTYASRIYVIESHPSFPFQSAKGMVTQVHIGPDSDSCAKALEITHQADLDVVAVDDIPTLEALRQMLLLCETGHLVIANMHADNVCDVIQRLSDRAGTDGDALRRALAKNLLAITNQRLFPRIDRKGRVPAYEWVINSPAVANAIRMDTMTDLSALLHGSPENRSMDAALVELYELGKIDQETFNLHRNR